MTRFGIPGQNIAPLAYSDTRLPTVPMVEGPRAPTVNDKKYPLWCEWRVSKDVDADNQEGDWWKLVDFVAGDAIWVKIGTGTTGPSITLSDTAGTKVSPDVNGNIQLVGTAGQINIVADPANNLHTFSLAGGGTAVDQVNVDFNTAPGTDPVVPTATGEIQIYGNTVTPATNANAPVATHSRAANQFHIDVQLAVDRTGAPVNPYDVGLCSFNDTQFIVDENGYVSIVGATDKPLVQTLTGDNGGAVGPDASGDIDINGTVITTGAATQPLYFRGTPGSNKIEGEIQTSSAQASANVNKSGIAHFDSAQFTVDSTTGFVQMKGGVFWTVITQATQPANFAINTGYICQSGGTGNVSIALPTSSSVGDEIAIVLDGATTWTITQGAGQQIRFSGSQTTLGAGGSISTTGTGDMIRLVCSATNTLWVAVSGIGNLTVT